MWRLVALGVAVTVIWAGCTQPAEPTPTATPPPISTPTPGPLWGASEAISAVKQELQRQAQGIHIPDCPPTPTPTGSIIGSTSLCLGSTSARNRQEALLAPVRYGAWVANFDLGVYRWAVTVSRGDIVQMWYVYENSGKVEGPVEGPDY